MADQAKGAGVSREERYRRIALLYFLPLVILNFLAGTKVMAANPGLFQNEHYLGLVFALLLSGLGIWLWRDASRLMVASYFMCGCLAVFFLYREGSLLYGPSSRREDLSMFMPLFGYHAVLYFSFLVFLPRQVSEKACWAVWFIVSTMALVRMLPQWDYFSTRQGAPDLLIFLLIANPMLILLGRLLLRVQDLLSESERDLARSQRELDLQLAVARGEERFQRAVDGSRDGLWEWQVGGGTRLWMSFQVSRLLGIKISELPASMDEVLELVEEERRLEVKTRFEQARGALDAFEVECRMRTGAGEYRWFGIKGVASRAADGHVYVSGSLQSIQRRREAEDKLRASNEALSQFAAVAAHDLKSPARKIGAFVDLVRRKLGERSESVEAHLAAIQRLSGFMLELISRLLSYASADAPTEAGEVRLRAVLEDVLEMLDQEVAERGAEVVVGDLPVVWSNAGDMRQVFQNLIANALKFCERTPRVEISSRPGPTPSTVEVIVRDNGIGIENKYLAQIHKPLTRLHSSAEYEGFGLGLATVVRIVERNRGRLTIESTPGEGSVFIVCLQRPGVSDSDSA